MINKEVLGRDVFQTESMEYRCIFPLKRHNIFCTECGEDIYGEPCIYTSLKHNYICMDCFDNHNVDDDISNYIQKLDYKNITDNICIVNIGDFENNTKSFYPLYKCSLNSNHEGDCHKYRIPISDIILCPDIIINGNIENILMKEDKEIDGMISACSICGNANHSITYTVNSSRSEIICSQCFSFFTSKIQEIRESSTFKEICVSFEI
jgi:hypothetical protein